MATVTINTFTITKNVANGVVDLVYTVNYDTFDQLTNVGYHETYKLMGDDTGQDGDDGAVGDNQVGVGFFFVSPQRSNGQASVQRTQSWSLPWADLNEDSALGSVANNDDEIRAVVTLEPELPVTTSRESAALVLTSP